MGDVRYIRDDRNELYSRRTEAAAELTALREAKQQSDKLLKEALDLFHGTHELCDEVNSDEWIW